MKQITIIIQFILNKFCYWAKLMKIGIFLCFFSTSAMMAESAFQEAKIILQPEALTIKELFSQIEEKSDFVFLISDEVDKELNRTIELNTTNEHISTILDNAFKETDLAYLVTGRQITIYRKKITRKPEVVLKNTQQGKIMITGVVKDDIGESLPGVNIIEKGTSNGSITDIDGKFQLQVSDVNAILVFSFIGYASKEVAVGNQREINVILYEATRQVGEVVVVGYGSQKKESIVGAITQATNETLMQSGNVTDLKQALTGRLPGVTTTTSTGEPGGVSSGESATSIFIRGRNSWNNSQPLILVDGAERNMDNIDVSEVESISVLKDASATAVFGVKGANGVILINTKRGKISKPELSLSYSATALMISKLPDKMDSYDALMLRNESIEREVSLNETYWGDYTPYEIIRRYRERDYPEYAMIYPNVDWTKALFKDVGWSHKAALNIRGGTNFVKYFGSLTYLNEGDMFKYYDNHKGYDPNYDFNRFNFRSNLDFSLTKTTNLKINLAGYFSQKNTNYSYYSEGSGTNPLIWSAAYTMPPDVMLPQYEDGTWGQNGSLPHEAIQNPVAQVYNLGIWKRKTTTLNADFSLEQKLDFITKGLSANFSFFYDNSIQTVGGVYDNSNHVRPEPGGNTPGKYVIPELYEGPWQDPSEYTMFTPVGPSTDFDWIVRPWYIQADRISSTFKGTIPITRRTMYQAQINYNRKFELHNVGAMGLFKREEYAEGSMFPTYREDWVFRTTYDYDSKYLLEFNGAYNGSEKFSKEYRFDFFPSLAVGWYLTSEKFFKVPGIDRIKLRYSIGMVGDDHGTGQRWLYQSQYAYNGSARLSENIQSGSPYTFYKETVVANPDIHWEKAKKQNFGAEFGFFNELISVNFDYFTENRSDIMIRGTERAIPPYFGANPPTANLGKVKSKGQEIELNFNKRTNYGFDYWASLAITHTRNEVLFRDDPQLQPGYLKQAGYSIGQSRGQLNAGFYNNWDDIWASVPQQTNDLNKIPGMYNIVDFNGDGLITGNEDSVPFGFPDVPENTYNLTIGASYKGVSLMLQFYGVNNVTRYVPFNNFNHNLNTVYEHAKDYWSKDNQNADSFLPRWKTQGTFIGDYYYYDGSYIRLKTAEISYSLPKSILDKIGVSELRLFVNGHNLWFWSRLPDDRENHWGGGSASQGAYPSTKRINAGFNINF